LPNGLPVTHVGIMANRIASDSDCVQIAIALNNDLFDETR
jgi:hypothetical protein